MRNWLLLLISFILLPKINFGQTCIHADLSKNFVFKSAIERIKIPDMLDSCIINISILEKTSNKNLQTIHFTSTYMFEDSYSNCNSVRSYFTGKNAHSDIIDNDFGDLIVADFNFDGKEDIAIKNSSGGNGGPSYSFFLQMVNNQFVEDNFLTNEMVYFPIEINKKNKTLTTLVHANAYQQSETTYKLIQKTNKWKKVKSRLVKY